MSRFYQSSLLNFGNANVGGSLAAGQSAGLSLARMKEEKRRYNQQQQSERTLADLVAASYDPQTQSVNPERLMGLTAQNAPEHMPTAQAYAEQARKRQMEQQQRINEELWAAFGGAKSDADMEAGKAYLKERGAPDQVLKNIPPYSPQAIDRLARMALGPKEYMEHQRKAEYTRGLLARPAKTSAAATTVNAKIAAIKQLNLDPGEEAAAIQAVVGARAKPGGRDAAQADAIARYKAQYPLNPLTGQPPKGAPSFEEFMQMNQPAQPKARTTPEGFEIIGENPDGSLKVRDPKTGRTGTYRP